MPQGATSTETAKLRVVGLSAEESRIIKARSPVAWLRPVLLLLGILAIAAVGLMLAAYRFGRAEVVDDEAAEARAPEIGEAVLSGQGFDYTQSSEGDPVFRIRADKSEQDREGTSILTTVVLDVFHQDGHTYTVRSDHARVNETSWEARLEGNVLLSGWDRLELEARVLELRQGGQVLESSGAVEFRYPPELMGRASHLKVDRRSDTITLSGGVHLHSVPGAPRPTRLDCQRLVFQRSSGTLRAVGDASLQSADQYLEGHYLTIFLAPDGHTLESARARWNVVGKTLVDDGLGGTTVVEYRGEFLDLQPDTDPASRRIKLDGEGGPVTLSVTDLTGLKRAFTGLYLVGHTRNNRLVQVEGVGQPLVLLESLDLPQPFPLRQACADRVTARFLPEGGVSRVQLESRVELNDRGLSISGGEKAALNMEDGAFRVEGDEVLLSSARGEVTAPHFSWSREKGIIRARGGVRAVLAERSLRTLRGTPLGQGRGPVQVEAEEAYWTSEPPTFTFEKQVRAWRGESLLLADQLRGDEAEGKLAASGGVRTVWVPSSGPGPLPGPAPEGRARDPIEVSAGRVSYAEKGDRLLYEDEVELRQGRRSINCRELSVDLSGGGRAERMTCSGDVRMTDLENGRRVQGGDRAVFTLADDLVEIFGDRVEVQDAQNSRMRGRYLRYDLRTGTFKIKSRADEGTGAPSR